MGKFSGLGKGLVKQAGIYGAVWQKLTVEGKEGGAKQCLRKNKIFCGTCLSFKTFAGV